MLFPQCSGSNQIIDQPASQRLIVITKVAGIDVPHEGQAREKLGQGVTGYLPLFEHEEGEHHFQRMTGQPINALLEGSQATEGTLESSIYLRKGAPCPGITTLIGRRASISSVSRVDFSPSGLPSNSAKMTPKPSSHSASPEMSICCSGL